MLTKLDPRATLKHLYNPSARDFTSVQVPAMNFLMIDGIGDPNTSQAYKDALNALYSVAYTLKFTAKKAQGVDYPVMPLEGLWWTLDPAGFSMARRAEWQWKMFIMQPDLITAEMVEQAKKEAVRKKELPALPLMRFEPFEEGLAIQILYIGPYRDEGPTIARMHQYIEENGYELHGKHHEIYLGDPRRTAPEKLKTVIRHPIRPHQS